MKKTMLTLSAAFAFAGLVHAGTACCSTRAAKASAEDKTTEAKTEVAAKPAQTSSAVIMVAARAEKPVQVASADKAEKATCSAEKATCSVEVASCDADKECSDKDKADCDAKAACDAKAECEA